MTALAEVLQHPVCQQAVQALGPEYNPTQSPLLQWALKWLRDNPGEFSEDLEERVAEMLSEDPVWGTSLAVPDLEELYREMDEDPDRPRLELFREALDSLQWSLRRSRDAGRVVAENVSSSLKSVFPSFGNLT